MNEVKRAVREDEEVNRIRDVVERHAFPPMVVGFDIELGEFDGDPAMWIIFKTVGERPDDPDERRSRINALRRLRESVHDDLLGEIENRYPYYRFLSVEPIRPTAP